VTWGLRNPADPKYASLPKQREGRAKKAFAAGRLSGHEEARIASVLKDAERAYGGFSKAKPFWS